MNFITILGISFGKISVIVNYDTERWPTDYEHSLRVFIKRIGF